MLLIFSLIACRTVGEAHAERNQQIRLGFCLCSRIMAVHTDHSERIFAVDRHRRKSHQREAYRRINELCKFGKLCFCVCRNHTAATIYERAGAVVYHLDNACNIIMVYRAVI